MMLRATTLAAAASLAACVASVAEPQLFPLNEGWRWEYRAITQDANGTASDVLVVENRAPVEIVPGLVARHRYNSLGNHYYFIQDASGVYRAAARHDVDALPALDGDVPRRFVLKSPIGLGTTWQASTHPYLMKRGFDWPRDLRYGMPVQMAFRIDSIDETVEVPAGRFEHCVRVVGQHTLKNLPYPVMGYAEMELLQREWYCPGVGLARFERKEPAGRSKYYTSGSYTLELVALRRR
jgi:hypothetical protein